MKLNQLQLNELTVLAEDAATRAGEMIESIIESDPRLQQVAIQRKDSGSSPASQVVTEVDLKSERIILEILKPSLQQYDLALLSEETLDDNSRFNKDYFWCIDPLDGTLAFTESRPGFSVSIALVSKQGIPKIGIVYDPSKQNLYSATVGQGVKKNNKPWLIEMSVANPDDLTEDKVLTVIAENNLIENSKFQTILENLRTLDNHWTDVQVVKGGGAVMNACNVLENQPAIYFKLPKKAEGGGSSWDFAATSAIFNELGLAVSDIYGVPLELNRKGSIFMNHCGVVYASDKKIAKKLIKLISNL